MILFQCPGMIGPVNTATPARRQIILPFWGWERFNFMILGPKFFAYGQSLRGRSVVTMEITFMDMEDKALKIWYFMITKVHIFNPLQFPISSLGSPIFLLRTAERERWQNMPPMTAHQIDRIVVHNYSLHYL
jgi:hypothetical protein